MRVAYATANGLDLAITSIETITCFDPTNGDYLFTLDELLGASISQEESSTDVLGRNGRLLTSIKRGKGVTVTGQNGLVSGGLLARQVGNNFERGATYIMWTDYITISSNPAENVTSYRAVGAVGSEITHLLVRGEDGTIAKELVQSNEVSASGSFSYNPGTKELSFYSGDLTPGTEIVAIYKRLINARVLKSNANKTSGKGQLYVDAFAEDMCSNVYRIQFFFPKVSFSGNFSFDISGDQVIHEFEARAEAGGCGNSHDYFTYTVFGENEDDESLTMRFVTMDEKLFTTGDADYFSVHTKILG